MGKNPGYEGRNESGLIRAMINGKEALIDPEHEKELEKANAAYTEILRLRGHVSREKALSGTYEDLRVVNVRELI